MQGMRMDCCGSNISAAFHWFHVRSINMTYKEEEKKYIRDNITAMATIVIILGGSFLIWGWVL